MAQLGRRRQLGRSDRKRVTFIADAIKRPGALTLKASRAGALTRRGTIKQSFLNRAARAPGLTGQQARLALQLRKFNKRR